jgi:hypothetical protein
MINRKKKWILEKQRLAIRIHYDDIYKKIIINNEVMQ